MARINIRVAPAARAAKPYVAGRYGDGWKVRLTAPAEKGKANAQLIKLISEVTGVSQAQVELVHGGASRNKLIDVNGISDDQIGNLMDAAMEQG